MSLCPYRLLRSRFSSGLQSCAPPCRISLGHWHRPRTQTQVARYAINDARYSNTGASGGRHVDNGLETSAIPQSDIMEDIPQTGSTLVDQIHLESTYRTDGKLESSEPIPPHLRTESLPKKPDTRGAIKTYPLPYRRGRARGRITPVLTKSSVTRFFKQRGIPPSSIAPNHSLQISLAIQQINDETTSMSKYLSPSNLAVEAANRAMLLYTQEYQSEHWYPIFVLLYTAKRDNIPPDGPIPGLLDGTRPLIEMINTDLTTFTRTWWCMNRRTKAENWQRLAFWLLQHSPLSVPGFLFITTKSKHKPNCHMVANCIYYLDTFYRDQMKDWRKNRLTYTGVIQTSLNPNTWPVLNVPQYALRAYVKHSQYKGLCYAVRMVKKRQIFLSFATILAFINRFIFFRDVRMALAVLEYIRVFKSDLLGFNSTSVLRHCCKLLTLDSVETKPEGRNFRILPRLLEMGVRPDRDMMNVVMYNAFKTGDPQLGQDMLDFMKSQGHEFDAYTYSILLTDAVSRGDRERVVTLMHEIDDRPEVRENKHVMGKLIHAHYVFTAKKMDVDAEPAGVFYAMLDIYNRFHDITPLKDLFIIPREYTPPVQGVNKPPSLMALYIIIATYFRCQQRLSNIERIYSRFRALVLEGHPIIAPLAATDHTYNEFLVALRHNSHGLRLCVRIVEDMIQSPSNIELATDFEEMSITHAKPTVRSWTILLSAFIYNKQPYAAERVKEMMSKHKVKFNQVVWNTVISGHASSQNIPETAKAIRIMEQQGFTVDEYTLRSLRYLRNPDRLWVVLDELDKIHDVRQRKDIPTQKPEFAEEDEEEERDRMVEYEALLDQGLRRLEKKKRNDTLF